MTGTPKADAYADYLRLDLLLAAQQPLTHEHDELLFVIYHQVTELWFKLLHYEFDSARHSLRTNQVLPCLNTLARVERLLHQMVGEWIVLETLTPAQFARIRPHLGGASGLQSTQYRDIEHILGKRDPTRPETDTEPSLFEELLHYLHRAGHPIPKRHIHCNSALPRAAHPELRTALAKIRAHPAHRIERQLFTSLTRIDTTMLNWRQRHVRLAKRMIGDSIGTAGTAGVNYLTRQTSHRYFPELASLSTVSSVPDTPTCSG